MGRRLGAFGIAVALALAGSGTAHAQTQVGAVFGPYGDRRFEPPRDAEPSAEALLQASLLAAQEAPARRQADGAERYEILDRRVRGDKAVLVYRVLSKDGDALAFARSICPTRTTPIEAQSLLFFADGYWSEFPGDSTIFRDLGCQREVALDRAEQDEWLTPPRFSALGPTERAGVTEPTQGSRDRTAILDGLRAWNRDLNLKTPIVFVVRILRRDARHAYVVAKIRQKADGKPLPRSVWGACEQDPEDGEVEALLELTKAGWKVILGNRCADDVMLTEDRRAKHRVLVMPP